MYGHLALNYGKMVVYNNNKNNYKKNEIRILYIFFSDYVKIRKFS